ncbi:ABC transporter substrate-binding protein, partial [Vibrio rotiferianus]
MSITTYLNKSRIVLALFLSTVLGTAQANEPPVYKLTLA